MTVPAALRRLAILSPGSDSIDISSQVHFICGWENWTWREKRAELVLTTYWSAEISATLVRVIEATPGVVGALVKGAVVWMGSSI